MLEETARVSPWKLSGDNPIDHTRDEEKEEKCKACRAKNTICKSKLLPTSIESRKTDHKTQSQLINTCIYININTFIY